MVGLIANHHFTNSNVHDRRHTTRQPVNTDGKYLASYKQRLHALTSKQDNSTKNKHMDKAHVDLQMQIQ